MWKFVSKSWQAIKQQLNEAKTDVAEFQINTTKITIPQDVVKLSTLPYIMPCEKLQVVRNFGAVKYHYEHRQGFLKIALDVVKSIFGFGNVSRSFIDFQEQSINDFKLKVLETGGNYVLGFTVEQNLRGVGVSGVHILTLLGTVVETKDSIEVDDEMRKLLKDTFDVVTATNFHLKSPQYNISEDIKKV